MSIAKRLTHSEIESIYSAANSAVWHSHHLASRLAKSAAREEDYVATLLTNGIPLLAERWILLLSPKGVALRVTGIFCHGHPQVAFGTPKRQVELADLLVVHQHLGKKRSTSRAILIQAKMSADATHTLSSADPQLELFAGWPTFEFVTGGLARGLRNLKESGNGSRYALVLNRHAFPEQIEWADQCPWASCRATQHLSAERSFAKLLGDILLGNDGRAVQLGVPKDDWSRTIKELLEVTGQKTYKRTNIGLGNTPRIAVSTSPSAALMFLSESSSFADQSARGARRSVSEVFFGQAQPVQDIGDNELPPESARRDDPNGGMSALIIETREVDE